MPYRTFKLGEYGQEKTNQNMFNAFCQMMVNIGWEIHNTISAQDIVFKSNGEDGAKATCYARLKLIIHSDTPFYYRSAIKVVTYLYFPPSGTSGYVLENFLYAGSWSDPAYGLCWDSGVSNPIYCGGDKDMVFITSRLNGLSQSQTAGVFGHIRKIYGKDRRAITTTTLYAGDDQIVTLSNTSPFVGTTGFKAGDKVQVVGSTEGRWWLTISEIVSPTQLKFVNVPTQLAAGAYIGDYIGRYGQAMAFRTDNMNQFSWQMNHPMHMSYVGGGANAYNNGYYEYTWFSNTQVSSIAQCRSNPNYLDPNGQLRGYFISPVEWRETGNDLINAGYIGYDDDYLAYANGTNDNSIFVRNTNEDDIPYTGTITGVGIDYFCDDSKSYVTDGLVGKIAVCSYENGDMFSAKIVGNTATRINLAIPFDLNNPPQIGRQYAVSDECWRRTHNYNLWYKEVRDSNITVS